MVTHKPSLNRFPHTVRKVSFKRCRVFVWLGIYAPECQLIQLRYPIRPEKRAEAATSFPTK